MATGEAPPAEELQVARRFVLNRQGKDYVTYPGLIDLLHRESEGYFAIETQLVQAPNRDNGMVAICSARVLVYDRNDPDVVRRCATGLGDADPDNVGRGMAPHLIRLAETRAKARAIRDAVNVAMVAAEELGPEGAGDQPSAPSPAPVPTEHILIAGKPYTRAEVLAIYAKRLDEARAAGLAVGEVDVVPPERAPLASLVAKAQEIKRRLEARSSAK